MKKDHHYWVYILTNWKKKTLYTGVTNDLVSRLKEHYHNRGKQETFAGKNFCYYLIYYELHPFISTAIAREKEIKEWSRVKKEELIDLKNPDWEFLNTVVCGKWPPTDTGQRKPASKSKEQWNAKDWVQDFYDGKIQLTDLPPQPPE